MIKEIATKMYKGEEILVKLRYERIPRFYYFCGSTGHGHLRCPLKEKASKETENKAQPPYLKFF